MKALEERPKAGILLLAAAVLAVALVIAGCGGSSSSSSSGGETEAAETQTTAEGGETAEEGGSGGESSDAGIAKAEEEVDRLDVTEGLEWPKPPQKPFKAGHHTAAVISCGQAGEGCKDMSAAAQEALKAAGWSATPTGDGEFSPATQANLIQQAVQEGVDAIVLAAVDPASTKAAVDAAIAKGIPISCIGCSSPPEYTEKGTVIDSAVEPVKAGEDIGYWIVANSGGEGKIISFVDHAFATEVKHNEGTKKVVEELCPGCEYEEQSFATAELEKPGPPVFSAALSSNPAGSLDWVNSNSATYATPMVKTAVQQGREDVKIVGIETTPEFLAEMPKTEIANATLYVPFSYLGWAAVDNVIRQVNNQPTWETDDMPGALVTKETVQPYLDASPHLFEFPEFDFRSMFEKLWGVNG
jgi:ABC-type sugar transport system substrate-binding protein